MTLFMNSIAHIYPTRIQELSSWRGIPALLAAPLLAGLLAGCMAPKGGGVAASAAPAGGLDEMTLGSGWQMQEAAKVAETSGEAISQPGYAPRNWYPATVPGTILTTLVNNKVYAEPLWGENNRPDIIPETLCRTSYWYRVQFTVPAGNAGKRTWLNFHGINYMAEVFVNGKKAGDIKGAFARGFFDVTP